jgi:hypothetical protein
MKCCAKYEWQKSESCTAAIAHLMNGFGPRVSMRIYTASELAVMKSQLELSSMETFAAPCLNSQSADAALRMNIWFRNVVKNLPKPDRVFQGFVA